MLDRVITHREKKLLLVCKPSLLIAASICLGQKKLGTEDQKIGKPTFANQNNTSLSIQRFNDRKLKINTNCNCKNRFI